MEAESWDRVTPLDLTINSHYIGFVKILLDKGANMEARSRLK